MIARYEDRYNKYGYDIRTLGWGSFESQQLRFKILTEIGDLRGRYVCDLGCGFGDLFPFLDEHFKGVRYHGIDISQKLVYEAKIRYPKASFEVLDIMEKSPIEKFDYILSSGAMNLKIEENEKYICGMMSRMMEFAKIGISLNFLSTYVDYMQKDIFHFAPEKAFSLGKKITRFVTLRHDYPLYEFTLYLYHESKQRRRK